MLKPVASGEYVAYTGNLISFHTVLTDNNALHYNGQKRIQGSPRLRLFAGIRTSGPRHQMTP